MKQRKCKVCREPSTLLINLHAFCTYDHAIEWANQQTRKAYKAETVRRKRELLDNDRSHWTKKAREACHAYVRERDKDLPCISCGAMPTAVKRDAGHYRASGNNSALRFDADRNIFAQCVPCNQHKSGNLIAYRKALIERLGIDVVEWLDSNHEVKRWSLDELKEVHRRYTQKLNELQNEMATN